MLHLVLIFLGAMVLTNALPHLVNGLSGRAFQSPFARPPGRGLSSATTNVLWGTANLVLAWALLVHWGHFDPGAPRQALAALAGLLVAGVGLSLVFGAQNGGSGR